MTALARVIEQVSQCGSYSATKGRTNFLFAENMVPDKLPYAATVGEFVNAL